MTSVAASLEDMSEAMQTMMAKIEVLDQRMTALTGQQSGSGITANLTPAAAAEPIDIPRPPSTAQINRSSASCKPPREPSLTGDKQHEWQEFEREFLRYFRITQGYYMEPEVQVDLLLATAGEKVRKVF